MRQNIILNLLITITLALIISFNFHVEQASSQVLAKDMRWDGKPEKTYDFKDYKGGSILMNLEFQQPDSTPEPADDKRVYQLLLKNPDLLKSNEIRIIASPLFSKKITPITRDECSQLGISMRIERVLKSGQAEIPPITTNQDRKGSWIPGNDVLPQGYCSIALTSQLLNRDFLKEVRVIVQARQFVLSGSPHGFQGRDVPIQALVTIQGITILPKK